MVKFIVDTSVWIDFFRGKLSCETLEFLTIGIQDNLAIITDIIRHEILLGAKNKRHYRELSENISSLECFRIQDADCDEFDKFAWGLSQKGLLGKYTDASIAFLASKNHFPVLSFDKYFKKLSEKKIIRTI